MSLTLDSRQKVSKVLTSSVALNYKAYIPGVVLGCCSLLLLTGKLYLGPGQTAVINTVTRLLTPGHATLADDFTICGDLWQLTGVKRALL